mmetsp:Transcript_45261/g.76289  ORF Transcript_45261/g.76289 Transcript_45261/m.76289 type:complete len:326 (-) Transcript_45261:1529-2506(-)
MGRHLTINVQDWGGHDGLGNPSDLSLDPLCQAHEILFFGAKLRQCPHEEWQIGDRLLRQCVQIKRHIQVQDVVGENVMVQECGFLNLGLHRGDCLVFLGNIGHLQSRHAFQCLWVIRGFLCRLQLLLRLNHRLDFLRGHGLFDCCQTCCFFGLNLSAQFGVRSHFDGDTMSVIKQILLEQRHKHVLPRCQPLLEGGQRLLKLQGLDGVPVMEPLLQGTQHDHDPLGEATGVQLTHRKLGGVDGCLDLFFGEAVLCNLVQRIRDQRLQLWHILILDILHPHTVRCLQKRSIQSSPDHRGSETRLVQSTPQRGRVAAHDHVVQQPQG